ncbi:hypothetical protein L917_07229 [Phytophthora nicotianae]|uniref:Uncharacterized protein n=1 Tax=Phytophthora nicotianae TaxID=4792 RepID=W2LDY7_PHYNI|nr:hypothetical protein L917_07229 [Phytophthora nicotianae]
MSSKKTARQPEDESPNLRPYPSPRMDSTNESQVPGTESYAEPGAMPDQQYQETRTPAASAQAGPTMPAGPPPPVPQPGPTPSEATGTAQMLASLVNMLYMQQQAMTTSQQQMHNFMAQQARFQQEMYEMQARANRQKQKANPPKFTGMPMMIWSCGSFKSKSTLLRTLLRWAAMTHDLLTWSSHFWA